MPTLGFIGTGNMGGALATAAAKAPENRLLLANRHPEKAQALCAKIGGTVTDNQSVLQAADYVFLGVKPGMAPQLLAECASLLAGRQQKPVLVSMMAGVELSQLRESTGGLCPIIRILPNIPVSVGAGVTFYVCSKDVNAQMLDGFLHAMRFSGEFVSLEEGLFDAGSAVAGCGGAYAALFMEGLADGGLACGLPRKQAYLLAEQMVLGAAKWLLETGSLPAELKDATCSPGGTTIRGIRALEQGGFRSAAMEAVIAAYGGLDEL